MSTITKNRIVLTIIWDKDFPTDLNYVVRANCKVPDDIEDSGDQDIDIGTAKQTIARAAFQGLTGLQIQNQVLSDIDAALQALGTGAGSHTLVNDIGAT